MPCYRIASQVNEQLTRIMMRSDAARSNTFGRNVNINGLDKQTPLSVEIYLNDEYRDSDFGTEDTCAEFVLAADNTSHWSTDDVITPTFNANNTEFPCMLSGFGITGLWTVDATTLTSTGTSTATSTATSTVVVEVEVNESAIIVSASMDHILGCLDVFQQRVRCIFFIY